MNADNRNDTEPELRGSVQARSGSAGRQQQYLATVDVDWEEREAHQLSDVSPTEVGRQFVGDPLTRQQLETIVADQESLYVIGRLEYCDIYGDCRYFMRCAELGRRENLVVYCGTSIGELSDDVGDNEPCFARWSLYRIPIIESVSALAEGPPGPVAHELDVQGFLTGTGTLIFKLSGDMLFWNVGACQEGKSEA